jgi:polygalacturonase
MAKAKRELYSRNLAGTCAAGFFWLAAAVAAQGAVCDVTKYGATGNGKSLDTAAIQKAIDACHAAGGGSVVFNNGRFLSGTIFLKSNVTLRIETGAVLLSSANIADFEVKQAGALKVPANGEVADELGVHHIGHHLIYADNADNIAIEGGGTIDGQGDMYFDKDLKPRPRPSPLIEIWNSRDIRIQDITILKTPGWAIHPKNCDRVKIRGISLINNFNAINTDGIDPDSSRNVIISDSYIEAGDDCIVLKTTNRGGEIRPTENVTVTNCVLLSAASALKLGTESWGDFRHCVFSNCVIRQARTGIALLAKDGGTMEDVRFENITMQTQPKWNKGVEWPIQFDIERRSEKSKLSHIRDVSLSDITMVTKGRVLISGMPESLIDTLTMRNVTMRITGYEQIKTAHKNRGGNGGLKDAVDFGSTPSALIFGHAKNVDLSGVQVIWPEGGTEDRSAIFASNVQGLTTSGLRAPASGKAKAIVMEQ